MANDTSPGEATASSALLRKLGIGAAALLVLLVVLYFIASSAAFFRGVILPRVAKSLNSEITVGEASLRPFSQVVLKKLRVQPSAGEPLLTAEEVRIRYKLFSILRGYYVLNELTVVAPTIQIVREPNGASNLDSVLGSQSSSKPSTAKSDQALRLAVRNVNVSDGTVRTVAKARDGSAKTLEVTQLSFGLDRLENGQSGKVNLAAALQINNRLAPGAPGTNDLMQGRMDGRFDFKVDQQLLPQTLTGDAKLGFSRAEGAYAELAGLNSELHAEVTPTEIRQLALRFQRGGQNLGQVQASGPLDLAKTEGRLKLEVKSIDRNVLNLYGASRGWDFADSTLNATNFLDLARGGELIAAKGHIAARQLSIRELDQALPPIDGDIDYEVNLNLNEQTAVIRRLVIGGQQRGKEFLQASLDRPMTLTWAPAARGFGESTFQLALSQVNLKDWQSMLGTNGPSGVLDLQLNVVAKQDGKQLQTKAKVSIQDLTAQFATNQIEKANLTFGLEAFLENFKVLTLNNCNLEVQQRDQKLVNASGSAHYDLSKRDLNLQTTADLDLPGLFRQFPASPFTASNGAARVSSAIVQKGEKVSLTGNISLLDFTGAFGEFSFQDIQSALRYNVDFDRPSVRIHNASLTLRQGYKAAGNIAINGDFDLQNRSGRLSFDIVDLNENALAPILAPAQEDKKLVSISIGGSGLATYDPKGDSSFKADLKVANWVVAMPGNPAPAKLSAQLKVDGSMRQQILDLRQFLITLSPTARAKNELDLTARLDFGTTNAGPSQLTVRAESLDLTPFYLMFSGGETKPATARPAPPKGMATEPPPAKLPLEQLTAEVKVDRLYLHEVAVTNLQATAKLNRDEVIIRPIELTLNGGPISANANINLGVPGYTYDLALKADRVPIEPLSNTFTTNRPGTHKGDLIAEVQIKGAGVTGPSLQKNLGGALSLSLTNMYYEIVGRKVKRLLEPVALVLRVPELMQTPLNWVGAQADIGKGQIDLQQFTVRSEAFFAETLGKIPMAEDITNSPLNLPVRLSLRRSLAEKANLLDPNTPTNAPYAPLPTFVTLTGTLGDPKTEINKLVIGGLLARSIGGIAPVGDKAGSILQGIGGILSGQPSAPAATNAAPRASTNTTGKIIQDITNLLNPPKKDGPTNAPPPATNKPGRINPLDLLKLIPEKK